MTATYHHHIEQGTPEWYELRRGIVTASIASKLLTPTIKVANNDTVRQLAYQMAAERITGRVEQTPTSYHMERGHIEEVFARDLYSQHHAQVKECGFIESSGLGFRVGYSPDGIVGEDGLIEIKSRMSKYQIQTICLQEVPSEYLVQLQFGLWVSARSWIDFVQYSNGMALFVQRVTPDPVIIETIEEAVSLFEERVRAIVDDYREKSSGLPVADYVDNVAVDELEDFE